MFVRSIRQILNGRRVVCVHASDGLESAWDEMLEVRRDVAVVLDSSDSVIGLLHEAAIVRHVTQQGGLSRARVEDVMKCHAPVLETRDGLLDALDTMERTGFDALPVRDLTGHCVGLLARDDIPAEFAKLRTGMKPSAA